MQKLTQLCYLVRLTICLSFVVSHHLLTSQKQNSLHIAPIEEFDLNGVKRNTENVVITESFEQLFQQANDLFGENKFEEAISYYNRALKCNPTCPQAHFNKGLCLFKLDLFSQAITAFTSAIMNKSDYTKAFLHLGKSYYGIEKYEQAIQNYRKVIKLEPTVAKSYQLLAKTYNDTHQFQESIKILTQGLTVNPEHKGLLFELANTYNTINRTDEALQLYKELLKHKPNNTALLYNTAYTLKKLGKVQEALPYYNKTLEIKPNHSEAHFSRGLAYLITGDFERGWAEYEWRWKRPQHGSYRVYPQPRWDGSPLHGKRRFLHGEQGLGDTLQFIRYAQIAKKRGGYVIVAVQPPLVTLINLCPYIDEVVSFKDKTPVFDIHVPLMSLPYILKTRIETVPCTIPYLYADSDLVAYWKDQLANDTNFKIGICWQGNSNYSTPFLRAVVKQKSIQLAKLLPLATIPGVSLYSLQRITGTDQIEKLPDNFSLHTFGEDFDQSHGRFMDTAAVIKNVDLVISIDTSICHLAAGLGTPTWNILPNPPDWRWMLDRTDTPWYSNMRLFRQPEPGDWDSVIVTIVHKLENMFSQKDKIRKYELVNKLLYQLKIVNQKFGKLGEKIQKMSHKDTIFVKHIRQFSILHELKKEIEEKISVLGDV